nr:ATP-binding protein [Bacteroidota bacterium]
LLHKDLLINVTSFFREKETFRYLKSTLLTKLLKKKKEGESLRIWVAACSTGQEAYSIAMLLTELQDSKTKKIPIQIFATDLSDEAIKEARQGLYKKSEIDNISLTRQKRFLKKVGDSYQVIKAIREMCVFAPHNILQDPPFSRMDLITCCNLLIYFDAAAQKKVMATFHFGLTDGGYLMLGKSETVGSTSVLFGQVNNKLKIYSRKKIMGIPKVPELSARHSYKALYEKKIVPAFKKHLAVDSTELDNKIDSMLLSRYMPACALINKDMEIIQFRGTTSLFLSHSSGKASLNILKMMRPEFGFELRNAIHKSKKTNRVVTKTGIEIKIGPVYKNMTLEVSPVNIEGEEPLFLIVFTVLEEVEKYNEIAGGRKNNSTQKDRRIKKLIEELSSARTEMQSIIASQEEAYEKVQAANEEIVSTSEEFQTLNEELETSKEETEATNEELISTNHELKMHNELLAESYNYSQTIIDTIHEPMIILDSDLHVKSANKAYYKRFLTNKENTESHPFFELSNNQWNIPELQNLLEKIISKNMSFENMEISHEFAGMGKKVMLFNVNRIIQKTHREKLILLAIEDVTERVMQQQNEKDRLKTDIRLHEEDKRELERAVNRRTRQLLQKNVELERANKDLTTFTYVSSHDLQEPLRKIQNFVTYIIKKEEKHLSAEGKGHFKKIQETSKRMQLLIEDLLAYSRTKNTKLEFEKTDLNVLLREVRSSFKEVFLQKKVKMKATLGTVNIIPFQFRQVFQNLISNSLKFSDPEKPLLITIQSTIVKGSKLKTSGLSPKYDYCHVVYTDNGIGFDPQYNERIFEVFQRLHSYEEFKGTGIGLAICKRIIENHRGVMTASGTINKGARFDIYLPV